MQISSLTNYATEEWGDKKCAESLAGYPDKNTPFWARTIV
jgi:hypothetical protein